MSHTFYNTLIESLQFILVLLIKRHLETIVIKKENKLYNPKSSLRKIFISLINVLENLTH